MANQELDSIQMTDPKYRLYYPENVGGPEINLNLPTLTGGGDNSEGRLTDLQKAIRAGFGAEDTTNFAYETSNVSKKYPVTFKGIDNEELYAQNQDWTDKAVNSLGKGLLLTGSTFLQGTVGLVAGLVAAGKDGRLASFYDNDFNRGIDAVNKKAEEEWMPNYESQSYRDASWYSPSKIFSANFLFEGIVKNLGFAAGAALSGGVYAAALKSLPLTARLFSIGKSAEAVAATEQGILAANKLASTYGKVKSLSDKFLSSYNVLNPAGRITVAGLATIGEASIEAYHNLNDFRNKAIEDYKKEHFGLAPVGADLARINELADGAGNTSFLYNSILLTGTNYIQFPKILGSSAKIEKSIIDDVTRKIGDVVKDETGKYAASVATTHIGKLLAGVKKVQPYVFTASEAFEEGAQYGIQMGVQDYYNKKNKGDSASFIDSLREGIKAVGTDEGMENVLIGGLSGAIMTARGTYRQRSAMEKATGEAVQGFNTNQLSDFTKSTKDSINRGVAIQEERETRLRQGDILESKDLEADYIINYLTPRIMFNRFDLVKSDIEEYKRTAQTEEGFAQLQAEGKALEGDTREAYLQRLSNLESTADNMLSLYQSLNLRYASVANAKGDRVYNKEVIEKMIYAATKVTDYDTRIPQLSNKLTTSVTGVFDALDQLVNGESEAFNKAMADIDGLDVLSEVKDELKQSLTDLGDIVLRRQMFLKEYDDIKNNPSKYTTVTTTESSAIPEEDKETVNIKTKDGEEKIEVGEEYFLGRVTKLSKDGKEVYRFPRLTILADNGDGTIKIKDSNGIVRDVSAAELEGYKLGKVSDTLNNKKAKYFMEHANTIYEFNFGEKNGGKKPGRLRFSPKEGILEFVYRDTKGRIKIIEVTNDQFAAKKGFTEAMIMPVGELTAVQQQAQEEFVKGVDDRLEAKRANRNKILNDLFDEVSDNISKTKTLLEQKKAQFEKIVSDLAKIQEDIKGGEFTKTNVFKRTTAKTIAAAVKLSRTQEQLRLEIEELEAQQEQLEINREYIADIASNIDNLPTDSNEFLKELKEQKDNIEDLILETGKSINALSKLMDSVGKALNDSVEFALDLIRKFEAKYPNLPYTPLGLREFLNKDLEFKGTYPEYTSYLQANPTLLPDLTEFENDLANIDELDVIPNERSLEELRSEMEALQNQLNEASKELAIKQMVLDRFQAIADAYREQQAEEKELVRNTALRQEFLGINSTDTQNETSNAKSYEAAPKKPWWAVVGGTMGKSFGKSFQIRANNFGNRFYKIAKNTNIKGIIVTAKNQNLIAGFENTPEKKGLIQHILEGTTSPVDNTIAMVMVQTNEDGTYTLVDEFGKPIPEGANPLEMAIYQVFPDAKLTATYDGKTESMFREDIAKDKDKREALEQQYDAWRKGQLAQETIGAPKSIGASFGSVEYVKTKDAKGKDVIDYNAQTGAVEAGLINESDLVTTPIVSVATNNDSVSNGTVTFNTPLGRVFLKVPGGLVKLLNRNFSEKEANLMIDVMKQVTANSAKDKTIKTERSQLLLNWLKSVSYWGIPRNTQTGKRKKAGYNNLFFEDVIGEDGKPTTKLFVSGKGFNIPFTATSIEQNRQELITLLKEMYNNANATMLRDKAINELYFEITGLNEDGTPQFKEWKNYQSFLLSGKDRKKGEIPFTTAFRPLVDENDSNKKDTYFFLTDAQDDYVFPQPAAVVTTAPAQQAKPAAPITPTAPTAPETFKFDGTTVNIMKLNSGDVTFTFNMSKFIETEDINASDFSVTPIGNTLEVVTEKKKGDVAAAQGLILNTVFTKLQPFIEAAKVPAPVSTVDVTPAQEASFDNDKVDAPSDEVYRLQNQKEEDKFEGENWKKVEAFLKSFLPNIPVYRVKNVIQATNGRQAWGMFRNGAIYIYENAEVGTAYHEVFHAVMAMFTDPVERQILMDEFRKRKGTFTALTEELEDTTIKYSEATDKQAEEQLAEEFKEFVLSGKKYKPEGSKYSIVRFFSELVDFIKEMFLGPTAPNNTEKLFDKIGNGYFKTVIPFESNLNYAKSGIIDIQDAKVDEKSIFSVAKIPQAQVHEIMEHMTYSILSKLAETNKSLFSVPTLNKTVEYDRLKKEVIDLIRWRASDQVSEVKKSNFKILQANVENQWDNIIKKHAEYLKTFSIEFDENDTVVLKDDSASGRGDWQDARQIDNFKKTNAAIRLLIGTLPIMEIGADGKAKPQRSTMGGMMIMPTDKTFITLMNKLHSSTNLDQMMARLRDLGISDPTYATLYKRLMKRFATTPGINYDLLNNEYDLQLISGFWRAFKKQNADVKLVFTLPSGDVVIGDSSLSTAARQVRSQMSSAIVSSIRPGTNKYVKYDKVAKEFTSQAAIKNTILDANNIEKYTEFLKEFGIEFNAKDLRKKLDDNQLNTFRVAVEGIKKSLSELSEVKALATTSLNIDGQLLKLGTVRAILDNPAFESTYFNLNGDRVQTYIGTNLISDMYDTISTIKNFNFLGDTKYKYLTFDAFSKGSKLLSNMFNIEGEDADGNRKSATEDLLKTAYVDGLVNEQTNKKKDSSRLNLKERFLQELNMNLEGYYMNLVPGDASIEWMVKLGQFVSKNSLMTKGYEPVHEIFKEYFLSEVNVAKENRPIVQDANKTRKSTDLRFFKDILSKEDHDAIVNLLNTASAEEIYNQFKSKIESSVERFINAEIASSRETLEKYGVITETEDGWNANGINFTETETLTDEFLNRELQTLTVNYMIANIEFHKLIYSDPYQYKDELKRIKNFNSPRQPLLANSPGINKMIDTAYNKDFGPEDKIGHTDFLRDFFRTITLTDVISKSDLKDYGTYKETDGGGYISMKANRNLRIRAGQWNELEENQFKFDIAYEKAIKNKATSEELAKLMRSNPDIRSAYTPLKPIVAGNKADGNNYNDVVLDKFALVPLSFRLLHQLNPTSNAINLYNKMQAEDIDYAVYATGRKVGAKTTFDLYTKGGAFNNATFTQDNISNIPFDIIGIQAEVSSKDTPKVTQGSQITKLVTMDFMEAGVPIDFAPEIKGIDARFAAWMALEDKGSYNDGDNLYNDIKTNQAILEEKINHGFNVLLNKLGLTKIIVDGKVKGYKLSDRKKMIDTLKNEVYKREINDNIIEAFEGFEKGEVLLEATPAYQQIRNILYSIADTNISSQKISGGMKVQAPSTLLESVRPIPGKDGAYQSDVLKFYEKDGERVCEIMVSRWFDTSMTDEELMDYFNNTEEGQELLRGVAYRIPTQSQNSIDVFKIAKFLPNGYGDTVVVPSALVAKVGSDFDIDKLSIYFKNIYKDADGKIRLVPFYGFGEDAKAKFGELFDDITKGKKELTEIRITKLGGLQQLLGDVLLGTASDKQIAKWIPIFKDMFGQDMTADDFEQALMPRLESAGKDIDKLNDADLQAALREEFIEKYYGKSLENAYIKSLEKLITNPNNFDALVQPNSAQELEDLSNDIVNKLGEDKIDYSSTGNMLRRTFMTELRHAFVTGKYAIGIAATANTNHAQSQRTLIYVDTDREISNTDRHYIGDGEVKLPHNQIVVNGKKRANLSMIKDVKGKTISDVIGMFIDGYVDISNGPWIMTLGATPNIASTWLFLTKIGVPIKTTAYFINQPIVRDYLRAIETAGYSYLFIDTIAKGVAESYDGGADINIETLPNEKLLGEMVGKKISALDDVQQAQQRMILSEFLKYAKMSEHLFKVQQATSFDTSSFNDSILIFKKLEQLKAAKNTVISSADALLENSFIGELRDTLEQLRNAYSEVLLSEKPRVRGVIEDILKEYIELNDRDFVKMAQKTINTMFDWAVQVDKRINNSVAYTLLGEGDVESAATEIMKFKKLVKDTPNHPLKDNIILNSIEKKAGSKDGQPDNLYLTDKYSKVYNQNQVIYGFNELKQSMPAKLYGRLVRLAIIQSGLSNSPISFSSFLPYEDFKEVYNDTLAKLEEIPNLATFKQIGIMERTLYSDVTIVPSLKAAWKKSKKGNWYSRPNKPSEMTFLDKKLKRAINNGVIPQMINISPLSREGISEFITFVWEDRELSKSEKAEMRRKSDYSYIKKGLFKKVLRANGEPVISSSTDKKGVTYDSYVYKAVNALGDSFRANEFYDKMMPDDADSTLVQQSVLDNGYIKVKEVEDSVIEGLLPAQEIDMVISKEEEQDPFPCKKTN